MSKLKVPKNSPSLDMTPMVDLAFLLVTFFMLTASFRATEAVVVDSPASVSEVIIPENYLMVSVDKAGRAFFNVTGKEVRVEMLEGMMAKYKLSLNEEQKKQFSLMTSFGCDIKNLGAYINEKSDTKRAQIAGKGIPLDSTDNQLKDWIKFGGNAVMAKWKNEKDAAAAEGKDFKLKKPSVAIKADAKTPYVSVKAVIDVFLELDINRFDFVTNLEKN